MPKTFYKKWQKKNDEFIFSVGDTTRAHMADTLQKLESTCSQR